MALHLTRTSDTRSYHVESSPVELRAFFAALGFPHVPGNPSALYTDRWTHGDGRDRTVLLFFEDSMRLSLLGPAIDLVDELADEQVTA